MEMDILAILMVAFGLFTLVLFILFYVYSRNSRNKKRENEDFSPVDDKYKVVDKDYDNLVDEDIDKEDIDELNIKTDEVVDYKEDGTRIGSKDSFKEEIDFEDFVPKKK